MDASRYDVMLRRNNTECDMSSIYCNIPDISGTMLVASGLLFLWSLTQSYFP